MRQYDTRDNLEILAPYLYWVVQFQERYGIRIAYGSLAVVREEIIRIANIEDLEKLRLLTDKHENVKYMVDTIVKQGAYVIAVASGKHEEFLRYLGADEFYDYTKVTPEDIVRDIDLVVDSIGGPETGRFLRTLKCGGALFPVFGLGAGGADEAEKSGIIFSTTQVRSNGTQLAEAGKLLDNGTLRVGIDSTFPLADARKAHERAAKGSIQGKIVLTVE